MATIGHPMTMPVIRPNISGSKMSWMVLSWVLDFSADNGMEYFGRMRRWPWF